MNNIKTVHQVIFSTENIKIIPNNNDNIKEFFDGYQHIVWDYKSIKRLIVKNNDTHILDAINSLKPNAYKADLSRYYIIYKIGGWYTDINNFFVKTPDTFGSDMVFFRDQFKETMSSWAVQNGMFYSIPNHKVLRGTVTQCVKNINDRYYGKQALCPTGPNLFGSIIAKDNLQEEDNYSIGNFAVLNNVPGYYMGNDLICKYKSNNLGSADPGIPGSNHYGKMWDSRDIYV